MGVTILGSGKGGTHMEIDRRQLDELTRRLWRAHGELEDIERSLGQESPNLPRLHRDVSEVEWTLRFCVNTLKELLQD